MQDAIASTVDGLAGSSPLRLMPYRSGMPIAVDVVPRITVLLRTAVYILSLVPLVPRGWPVMIPDTLP